MKSIRNELANALQLAEYTGELPNTRLRKAFRLQQFARCPKCDNANMICLDNKILCAMQIKCLSCNAIADINYIELGQSKEFCLEDYLALLVVDKMEKND